jgi:uncharacterized cupredoxin-like copper-binding protein
VYIVLMIILSFGIMSACTSKKSNDQTVSSTAASTSDATIIKIDLNDFSFSQNEINVKQNEKIHFVLTNTGKYAHDVNSNELKIEKDVDAGKTGELDWTAPQKAGSYQIICDKPGHAEKGMKLTLNIK